MKMKYVYVVCRVGAAYTLASSRPPILGICQSLKSDLGTLLLVHFPGASRPSRVRRAFVPEKLDGPPEPVAGRVLVLDE